MSGIIGGAGSKSGIISISGSNAPAFSAYRSASFDPGTTGSWYNIYCDTEYFDSHGKYDTSTGIFKPGVYGKYFLTAHVGWTTQLLDNSEYHMRITDHTDTIVAYSVIWRGVGPNDPRHLECSCIVNGNGTTSYWQAAAYQTSHPDTVIYGGTFGSRFSGFKLDL